MGSGRRPKIEVNIGKIFVSGYKSIKLRQKRLFGVRSSDENGKFGS